jgi:SulP family sulfate permease
MERVFAPKFFTLLTGGISSGQLTRDIMAGVVVGIVALPLAIAFAVASGVPPERGLITAVVGGFIISFLGGSRVQIGGPTGAFVIIIYAIVQKYGFNGLIISTVMAGLLMILFGLLKLGTLLKYFPHSLIVGFTSGIAVVIFSIQVKDLMGLETLEIPSGFIDKWAYYFSSINSVNIAALSLATASVLIVIVSKKLIPRIPGSLIALTLATIFTALLKIDVPTIGTFFGDISGKFQPSLPQVRFGELVNYIQPALAIALLGSIESLLSAVVADGMISGNHRSNTELIAQGVANVVTPLLGGIPATGAIARTATNVKSGARTPVSGMVHSVTLLLVMIFLARWISYVPMAALAGILVVVAYNMSEWRSFLFVIRGSGFDSLVLISTFFLTILVDLTVAIEVGVVLSALLFMKRMADLGKSGMATRVDSDIIDDYHNLPGVISIFEISGPFFFGSARQFSEVMKSTGMRSRIMIIRMRHVPFIDVTGMQNFKSAVKMLKEKGTIIVLSGVNSNVKEELDRGGIPELIGTENIFPSFEKAASYATELAEGF